MGKPLKPRIVLSGVNFIEAGPLSVYQDALRELVRGYADRYEIVALVHSRELFNMEQVNYLEFPAVKSSWLRRIKFEYFDCKALSRRLSPVLWLSMHDTTPNVEADIRAVYCHNPAPFYDLDRREAFIDWKFTLFRLFYRFLYAINLHKNRYIIVQQQWMRKEFERRYRAKGIVVARPSIRDLSLTWSSKSPVAGATPKVFFYPAFARSFKNFEAVLEATTLLEHRGVNGFEVWLTISGTENTYARGLFEKYGSLRSVRWLGLLPRETVIAHYGEADFLLFPSKLETWGMPISEFMQTRKPMIVADLPYAHETVGDYPSVSFFDPGSAQALADRMEEFLGSDFHFATAKIPVVAPPYARSWTDLFRILLS